MTDQPTPPIETTTEETLADTLKPAGFWVRVGAFLIDFVVLLPLTIASYFAYHSLPIIIAIVLASAIYKPVLEGTIGATVGKMALGLKVRLADGSPADIVPAILRSIFGLTLSVLSLVMTAKYIQAGINPMDFSQVNEINEIQAQNQVLNYGLTALTFVTGLIYLTVAFLPRKRGVHDLIGGTMVVYKESLPVAER